MPKKVELDILEEKDDIPEEGLTEIIDPGSGGLRVGFWAIIIAVPLFVLIITFGALFWLHQSGTKETARPGETNGAVIKVPQDTRAVLDGFLVEVKDEKGQTRLLSFDVIVVIRSDASQQAIENSIDLRKAVYREILRKVSQMSPVKERAIFPVTEKMIPSVTERMIPSVTERMIPSVTERMISPVTERMIFSEALKMEIDKLFGEGAFREGYVDKMNLL